VITAVYLLNRVPCKAVDGKTPFEVWHGKRPAVHHLKTFGCIVYVCNTKPHLKKLDDRGRKMIFVGYERGTKAYRAYDLVTKVTITRDVVFDEDAQWDWSSSEEEDVTWHDQGSDIFTVQYREVQTEAVGEGGGPGPDLDIPATPDAVQFGLGSPYGIVHDNPIFETEEIDNLDDSYNNEPLRFRSMSELIGPTVPPGQVLRELSTSESDRLFAVSAEEPTSVMEAT
jgi:hypothetical protein